MTRVNKRELGAILEAFPETPYRPTHHGFYITTTPDARDFLWHMRNDPKRYTAVKKKKIS